MSNCTKFSTAVVCFDDGTNTTSLVAHYEYGVDAAGDSLLVATRYTDPAGVPVDTSAGTVTVGECEPDAVFAPDVETEVLCDVLADGSVVEFKRTTVTTFDSAGAVSGRTASDFALDGVTAYVVQGTAEVCPKDCDAATAQGVLTAWG